MCQITANRPTKYDSNLRISDHRVTRHTCTKRKMSAFWLKLIACSVPLLLHHNATAQWMLSGLTATCVFNSISAELGSAVQGLQGFFHLLYFWARVFDSGPEHLTSGWPLAANSCITILLQSSTTPVICYSSSRTTLFINWTEQRPSTWFENFGIGWRTRVALCLHTSSLWFWPQFMTLCVDMKHPAFKLRRLCILFRRMCFFKHLDS